MDRYQSAEPSIIFSHDGYARQALGLTGDFGPVPHTVDDSMRRQVSLQSGLPLSMVGNMPLPPTQGPSYKTQMVIKRVFDLLASVFGLLFLAPLIVFVAVAIRIESKGPVLFRQRREGLHGRAFMAFKFRSMRSEACDASGIAHTVKGDPRITRVGAFLRRTSIDELPQLLNVALGEMSIVGPRPHVPDMRAAKQVYRALVPYYDHRLAMLPGITGWAQANGLRGDASDAGLARARIDHDLAYIQNFSLLLDLRILVRTIRHEFLGGTGS